MELVELESLSQALVGKPGISGLSVEQRKRLTIAVELVANPSIIFMVSSRACCGYMVVSGMFCMLCMPAQGCKLQGSMEVLHHRASAVPVCSTRQGCHACQHWNMPVANPLCNMDVLLDTERIVPAA